MADSVHVRFLTPQKLDASGQIVDLSGWNSLEEKAPSILWGTGTPNGDLSPFDLVNKGSLYLEANGTDDQTQVWQKVDEGGDNADWVRFLVENHALIDSSDVASGANFTVEAFETNALSVIVLLPTQVDISAADSEFMNFHAVAALTITEIGLIWDGEATAGSGAAEGDVTIGTTTGGAEIVAATSYAVSKAVGTYQALSLASGAMAAGTEMFVSHDVADSAAGQYRVQFKYDLDS